MAGDNGSKIVNSWNEFDPLKRVIVGRIEGTVVPPPEPGWVHHLPIAGFTDGKWGEFSEEKVAKATEQMEAFVKMLEGRGIFVDRPTLMANGQPVKTPDWEYPTLRGCMPPRDVLLPIGNEILECTMTLRSRWFEYLYYRPILEQYFKEDPDFIWSAAPKPRLTDDHYEPDYWQNFHFKWSDEELEERMMQRRWQLTDKVPLFDAADALRVGKDVFWQASCVSNAPGIDWLKRYFKPKGFRIHEVQFGGSPNLWHIDTLMLTLRPGLAIYNPEWHPLTEEFLRLFKINDWEVHEAAPPERVYQASGLCGEKEGPAWISMNTLSLDRKTICVEAGETAFMEQLDKLGMEVIPVEFDQVVDFGGELHCATVDVHRDGVREDYFPKQITGF